MTTMPSTELFTELASGILNATAANLGYTREELDRIVVAMKMDDELHRIILDAICCAAVSPWTLAAGYTANAAARIASAISERECETGLRLDMTKAQTTNQG